MSDWTGNLYFFYSEKNIDITFKKLVNIFRVNFDYGYQVNNFSDESCMLFYKDITMLNEHHNRGYHLNTAGLGCFGIEAKVVSIDGVANLHVFDNNSDFEPYNINLVFKSVNYYTLVLPESIENSDFCSKIYQLFRDILLDNH